MMRFPVHSPTVRSPRLKQRLSVWGGVLAGHVLVGYLLCWQLRVPAMPPLGNNGQMITVGLVSEMAIAGPVAEREPMPIKESRRQRVPAPQENGLAPSSVSEDLAEPSLTDAQMKLVSNFQPAAMGEPGAACDVTQQLAETFGNSPEVRQGIAAIPSSGRSVANAVMLWDGQWADGTQGGGMAVLRALLVKAVVSSRPECLQAQNQGPVLFLIPDNQTTVVLAIGSGQWRWADMLEPSPQPDVVASIF